MNETRGALRAVAHVLPNTNQPCWLDGRDGPDPSDLVSFPNGILDLRTGSLQPPDTMLFMPYAAGFDYDPKADEPADWLEF